MSCARVKIDGRGVRRVDGAMPVLKLSHSRRSHCVLHICVHYSSATSPSLSQPVFVQVSQNQNLTHFLKVDLRLPEMIAHLMKISHSDLAKVSRMVLVQVRAVVVLATRHTASTGVLAVLADAAVTGGDVAAAVMLLLVDGTGMLGDVRSGEGLQIGLKRHGRRRDASVGLGGGDVLLSCLCCVGRHLDVSMLIGIKIVVLPSLL